MYLVRLLLSESLRADQGNSDGLRLRRLLEEAGFVAIPPC